MRSAILNTFITRMMAAMLNFASIILLSKFLGAEGKGITARFLTIISLIQIICDFMGGAAMVYLSSRYRLKSLIPPAWCWSALVSLSSVILFFLIDRKEFDLYGFHLASIGFMCATLYHHIHLLSGREHFKKSNQLLFLQAVLTFIFLLIGLRINVSVQTYYYALYVGYGIPWILSILFLLNIKDQIQPTGIRKASREMVYFGMANQLGHFIRFATQRLVYFILPAYAIGVYSNAMSLSESLLLISGSISTVQFGMISNSKNHESAVELTNIFLRVSLLVTFIASLILWAFPGSFYAWLFGPEFLELKNILPLQLPGTVMLSGYLIIGHYFSGLGQFKINNISLFAGLLVTIILLSVLYWSDAGKISGEQAAAINFAANFSIFIVSIFLFLSFSKQRINKLIFQKNDLQLFISQIKKLIA